ncbi:multiple sugar transport system substrate-binding protein [Fontibacillus panacisegetis]|uniref:Multiple sugar transport system substrate-binding protein n=1 Tax=Fontibacillus panacisegetis TaxID=670482 RepID=A0A1G7P4R1_9BACL|nr:extracellular solute-binding protein [Fontibacillus panacisegetis]SDF80430.1 multiple sugar transport system substrate-binding protein [Fontibacillus panacisegetis]
MRVKVLQQLLLLLLMSGMVIAGCTNGNTVLKDDEPMNLKVMYYNQDQFFQDYGNLFLLKNSHIEIEVVSTQSLSKASDPVAAFDELIEKEQPDVILLNSSNFKAYAAEEKLMELDSLIERDQYNTETIYPALLELVKKDGNGKLYGLSPTFGQAVVFYNADLFKKYGIELPHDGMTWENIYDLARRFPTEGDGNTRVYGYGEQFSMSFNRIVQNIANNEGIMMVNPNTLEVTINTESWRKMYQLVLDGLNSNTVYIPEQNGSKGVVTPEDQLKNQPFIMGRFAMVVGGPYTLEQIKQAKTSVQNYKPFELGMVTGPVNSADPERSSTFFLYQIMTIRANSTNVEAAWEFIKFANGEEYAKNKSKSMSNGLLLSRIGAYQDSEGYSMDVFYKLKPNMDRFNYYEEFKRIPAAFNIGFIPIMEREIALVRENKKSIDDALQTAQKDGQELMDKALKEESKKK